MNHRLNRALCACVLCLSIMILSNCGEEDKDPVSPEVVSLPAGTLLTETATYTLSGDTVTMISTETECNDTVLVTTIDTSKATFSVSGNTLIYNESKDRDTLTRMGTGSGIQGTWSHFEPGTGEVYMVVSATTVEYWVSPAGIINTARSLVSPFFVSSGITIDSSSATAIKFTNTTSHEIVTLSLNVYAQCVWSSSDTAHKTLIATIFNISNCDPQVPDWFEAFVSGGSAQPAYDAALIGTWIQCDTNGVVWTQNTDTVKITSTEFTSYVVNTGTIDSVSFPPAIKNPLITYGFIGVGGNIGYTMSYQNIKAYIYDYTIIGDLLLLTMEATVNYTPVTKATAFLVYKKKV